MPIAKSMHVLLRRTLPKKRGLCHDRLQTDGYASLPCGAPEVSASDALFSGAAQEIS
jgi:hypothetical protein